MPGIIADLTKTSIQSSPDCFARVLRYIRRDTRDYEGKYPIAKQVEGEKGLRHGRDQDERRLKAAIIDISSDILSCSVQKSKSNHVGTFSLTLAPGRLNYHVLLHPGDHIFIWMKRNRPTTMVSDRQGTISPTIANNNKDSGLKLYGIITGVRRTFVVAPDGRKALRYSITGKDFGYYFDMDVYFNDVIGAKLKETGMFNVTPFGITTIGADLAQDVGGFYPPNRLVTKFLSAYMGTGPATRHIGNIEKPVTENTALYFPREVFEIFQTGGTRFSDILMKRGGIETYDQNAIEPPDKLDDLPGVKQFFVDVGVKYPLWAVLEAYSNRMLNEMFLDLKVTAKGQILPTFTIRQVPFTTRRGAESLATRNIQTTKFLDLPRIKLPEEFILREDLGRSDNERFNIIENFPTFGYKDLNLSPALSIKLGNYAVDVASINRYGLRALIQKTDYWPSHDFRLKGKPNIADLLPGWTEILADWWLGAHIYETGTIQTVGIEEPISIGDNLEIVRPDGVNELYHIEGYQHVYSVEPGGTKSFRTTVTLTRGQRIDELPVYASGRIGTDDVADVGITDTTFEGQMSLQTIRGDKNKVAPTDDHLDSEESAPDRKKATAYTSQKTAKKGK